MKRKINYAQKAKKQRRAAGVFLLIIILISLYLGICATAENTVSETLVIVSPNDTLWDICNKNKPDNVDLRKYISKVKYMNKLETAELSVGQELVLPNK